MKTLAVVPARGGSKGLPGKNARPFLGVPLLVRAIRIARQTCDSVVVTTDSNELAALAGDGVWVHPRPAELAQDDTPMLPVVQDAILGREGDVIVLLQPTQPLRTRSQVTQAIAMLEEPWDSVVSVRPVPAQYWPDRVMYMNGDFLEPVTRSGRTCGRRQDAREAYVRDGTVYVIRRASIELDGDLYGACRPLILTGDATSIDTLEDFERLEALASA